MTNQSSLPGLRTITPAAIASRRLAAQFEGLPAGMDRGELVHVIKNGGPRCGYSPTEVRRLVYLVRHTGDDDWRDGDGLPVVWKSVAAMAADLGVQRGQINAVERSLVEKGAIAHRDSGSRRRWGSRDPGTGRVTQAWGVDLRPLAVACAEFADAARAAATDERMKQAARAESLSLRCEIRQLTAALGRECELDERPLPGTAALAVLVDGRDRLLAMRDALVAELQDPGGGGAVDDVGPDAHLRNCATVPAHSDDGCRGCGAADGAEDGSGGGYGFADAEGTENRTRIPIHVESLPENGNRPPRSGGAADPAGEDCIARTPDPAGDNGPGRNQHGHGRSGDGQRLKPDPAAVRETAGCGESRESCEPGALRDAEAGASRTGSPAAERPVPFPAEYQRLSRFCAVWADGRLLVLSGRTGDRELRRALGRMKARRAIPRVLQETVVHSPERISRAWQGQDAGPGATGVRAPGSDLIDPEGDFGVRHLQPGRVAAVASPAFRRIVGDDPGWRELGWAVQQQRLALGIRDTAWRRAVDVLGIRAAAVLVAVIDGRCQDKASFVWNPSGFVAGCVKRAETGDLHLHRSVWGLERTRQWREARWAYAAPRLAAVVAEERPRRGTRSKAGSTSARPTW
ncbi:MAG: replication initiation protein RepC [bacterium]|nr:replication initiation protein RepC [bacterium]